MPTLLSPEFSGTAEQRADREAELRGAAEKLPGHLAVDLSNPASRPTSEAQREFDASLLAQAGDIFGGMSERALSEHKQYLLKQGVPEAKIDRAFRLDGLPVPKPLADPDLADLHAQIGVPLDAQPSDYSSADLNRPDLSPERNQNLKFVASTWASELRLDPTLGKAVLEHVAQIGAQLSKITPDERQRWTQQQESILRKNAGSVGAAVAIREKAAKALNLSNGISGPLGSENLSASIRDSDVGQSFWLLQTLAGHHDALAALEREKKKL